MLDHLRQRVIETLASTKNATFATYGLAGLQVSLLPCEAIGMRLYLLLPATSNHLLNLEDRSDVMVSTAAWQLRGQAVIPNSADTPPDLGLLQEAEAQWGRLVVISPTQLNIRRGRGWGYSETIDIDDVYDL
jgi:hypothetical protein